MARLIDTEPQQAKCLHGCTARFWISSRLRRTDPHWKRVTQKLPVPRGCHRERAGSGGAVAKHNTSAEELLEQYVQLSRRLEDGEMLGDALMSQAWCLRIHARLDDAATAFEESLSLARELGRRERVAMLLRELGVVAEQRDQFGRAEALLIEARQVLRETGNHSDVSIASYALGMLFERQSQYEQSETWYRDSLIEAQMVNDLRLTISALEGLARLAVARDAPEKAARLLGGWKPSGRRAVSAEVGLRSRRRNGHSAWPQTHATRRSGSGRGRQGVLCRSTAPPSTHSMTETTEGTPLRRLEPPSRGV